MAYLEERQEPAMLKPEEVSAILGVPVGTVRRWLRTGKLKGVKIGKLWLVSKEEINRVISG